MPPAAADAIAAMASQSALSSQTKTIGLAVCSSSSANCCRYAFAASTSRGIPIDMQKLNSGSASTTWTQEAISAMVKGRRWPLCGSR